MQCAIELSRRHQRVLAGPRTSPNTPSRACIVAWRGPGHFHRHWMARSLRSAPGQLGVVRVTRTRIGPRQKGGGAIWALAVSLSSVVKRICGLAVLLTAERVKFRFVPGSVIGGLCESFRLWGPPLCPQRGGRTSSKLARSPISGRSDPGHLETRSRSSRGWCRTCFSRLTRLGHTRNYVSRPPPSDPKHDARLRITGKHLQGCRCRDENP